MMKKKITKQPKVFQHLPDIFEYYECFLPDGTLCAYSAYRDADWQRQIHFEVCKWSHSVARELKKDFAEMKAEAQAAGLLEICGTYPDSDGAKWGKFIKLFNFPKPEKFYMSILEI